MCRQNLTLHCLHIPEHRPASVAQLDAPSDWRPGGRGFNPRRGRQHSFEETDHEIFSTVILSLLLIQEGQLSVCVEVLRASQPNGVMSSAVSLPNHRFTGQA